MTINFGDYITHICHEAICVKCLHRWIEVRPESTLLRQIECPNCKEVGYVIATGEQLFDENGEIVE